MKTLCIEPMANVENGNFTRRCCKILRLNNGHEEDSTHLWFDVPRSIDCPAQEDCDVYLIALIMDAMKENRKVVVKGNISESLLVNLKEFQAVWKTNLPEQYSQIEVITNSQDEVGCAKKGVISAFSGGIDSLLTVYKNRNDHPNSSNYSINTCVSIFGFDIPLEDKQSFENVLRANEKTLSDYNISVLPIATNYREIASARWSHSHGAALAATMHNFTSIAKRCLIGSTFPYNLTTLTWGSNPISDPLLSSSRLSIVHDGAAFNRVEKVAYLKSWSYGLSRMRVCWQGQKKDKNCGECEKCTRTKLNLLACRIEVPDCFEKMEIDLNFPTFRLHHEGERIAWRQLVQFAEKNGITSSWLPAARKKSREKSFLERLVPNNSARKAFAKKIARRFKKD